MPQILPSAAVYDNGNSGTSKTIDWNNGGIQKLTLTGNCTLTFSNLSQPAYFGYSLLLIQDGTGNRTVTWPAAVHWAGGTAPTLSTAASKTDWIQFLVYDGSVLYARATLTF